MTSDELVQINEFLGKIPSLINRGNALIKEAYDSERQSKLMLDVKDRTDKLDAKLKLAEDLKPKHNS